MDLSINSFYHQAVSRLEERTQMFISNQDKRILLIAAAILALFIVCCAMCSYCFKATLLNGQAKRKRKDGAVEEGEFKDDRLNGRGKITSADGATITEGSFRDGVLEGLGKITCDGGKIIKEGTFRGGVLEGKGKVRFVSGAFLDEKGIIGVEDRGEWEGEFLHGEMHKGKMVLDNGKILEGEFKKGNLWKGKVFFLNGEVWDGEFSDELWGGLKLNGQGKKEMPTGEVHEGRFDRGELKGRGIKKMPNGDTFDGVFYKYDAQTDTVFQGTKTDVNGNKWEGRFNHNYSLIGRGTVTYVSGMIFEGDFDIGQLRKGKVTFPNGRRIVEGDFGTGFDAHGIRKYVTAQGILYEQENSLGIPGGPQGKRTKKTLPSGETREGNLINQVIHVDKVTYPDGREEMKSFQEPLFN